MRRALCFAFVMVLLAVPMIASAQSGNGSVVGTVSDQSGAAIPGVKLTAKHLATGTTLSVTSDESGLFRFPVLRVGTYEIAAEKADFAPLTQKDVVVTIGARIDLPLTLQVAGQAATVTVSSETPLVETTRSQVSSTVGGRSISSLPVNGRNFIDFVLLTPGVTRDTRFGDISFAGQRGTLNSLIVDGSDNNNTFFGQTLGRTGSGRAPYQFSQDSVQEFQVNSNAYSAELGRAGGAVINVVTKSGSNDWHGMGFWYYRDRGLNATDLIDKNNNRPKAPFHFNQFGGNFSGPISRDKLFFFFNYDGQRNTLPNTVFLNLPTGFTPTTPFETQALAYLTERGNSWVRTQNQNSYLVKVDWNIAPQHALAARWNHQRFTGGGFENGGAQNSFEHTGASLVQTDTLSFTHTWTISPTVVNVARGAYVRDREPGLANSANPEAAVRQTGLTVLTVGRNFFSPRETTINRGQWADSLSLIRGKHNWKFGADFVVDRIFNFFPGNFSGAYFFTSLDSFGRSLAGQPLLETSSVLTQAFAGSGTSGATTNPNIFEFSFFAQDEWRIKPSLTLNLGLRYDRQKSAEPEVQNAAALAAGIDTAQLNTDSNNFAPRVGVAWSPFQQRSLVVRLGYGIFYGRTPSIMVGTAHSNNGTNVQTLQFRSNTNPVIPSYPNSVCGAPDPGGAPPSCPAPATVTGAAPIIFVFSPDYAQPLVHQGSLGIEYEFKRDFSVGISYLGVGGTSLQRTRDINLGTPTPVDIPIAGTSTVLTYQRFPTARPITAFNRIAQFESTASSEFHGATLQVNKRFSKNYQFSAAYTFGKVLDDKPDATSVVPFTFDDAKVVQNPLDPADDRGPGESDQRHRFVLSGIWDLKYVDHLNGVAKAILGGWEFSFILLAQSGQPFSGAVGADLNRDGNSRSDRAPEQGRNSFNLPNIVSFDPRVTKNIRLTERVNLQLFGEAFNAFNRANISSVISTQFSRSTAAATCGVGVPECLVPSTSFGRPSATTGPRIVQVAARITF